MHTPISEEGTNIVPIACNTTTTTICNCSSLTTTIGSKRNIDSIDAGGFIDADDPDTDDVEKGEDDTNIFSEDNKLLLSTRVSQCKCGGFRICLPCFEIYKPILFEKYDQLKKITPFLCKRDCEDESACSNDWTCLPVLPCTVCKRMNDSDDEVTKWEMHDFNEREELRLEEEICPDCMGMISEETCSVCGTENDL